MIYDVVIIGAGAAGLFSAISLDKNLKKVVLEKTNKPGTKVLLSGGERANVSNMDIEPTRDYFSQNRKFLLSVFSKYNQWDIMSFFAENNINIVEEDRGRLILESGDSRELLDCLLDCVKKNNCEIKLNSEVVEIQSPHPNPLPKGEGNKNGVTSLPLGETEGGLFQVTTAHGTKYQTKNVIVSSGGKSFYQVGTTGDGYDMANKLGLNVVKPQPCLCGLSTKTDLSELSGVSDTVKLELYDTQSNKTIYQETGPMLFTHFGVSGPIIHNSSVVAGEYLNSLETSPHPSPSQGEGDKRIDTEKYLRENLVLRIKFDVEKSPKRIIKFFGLDKTPPLLTKERGQGGEVCIPLLGFRSWKEAKATSGGVDTAELDNTMQSKKHEGLYFIGEVVDVTGKTGGFNLQRAWSSAYVAAEAINKKNA